MESHWNRIEKRRANHENAKKDISIEKENGRFYTPDYLVKTILDMSGYHGAGILKKHVIDNSCGDGAFLTEIAQRYYAEAKRANYSEREIKNDFETYIHGIEIEAAEKDKCVGRLDQFLAEKHITDDDDKKISRSYDRCRCGGVIDILESKR